MAGDWIRLKTDLGTNLRVIRLANQTGLSIGETVFRLYLLAGYFKSFGDYGKLRAPALVVDARVGCEGFAVAMLDHGLLVKHSDALMLSPVICDVSQGRKSLGRAVRAEVLGDAKCAACGSSDALEIDHIVPISRGGSSERDNLQALCESCNRAKGRRTMDEFISL